MRQNARSMTAPLGRRGLLAVVAAMGGALLGSSSRVRAERASPDKHKVVYHLSDLDKVAFVLGNIRHHFEGMGGPGQVTIALVVHGAALRAFHASQATADLRHRFEAVASKGLTLNACGNTMAAQRVTLKDLLPGFVVADRGGVVRIAELQADGYVYLRP